MTTWKEYVEGLRLQYVGRKVLFEGSKYTIVDVDINGLPHIDRKTKYNDTTAVRLGDLKEVEDD